MRQRCTVSTVVVVIDGSPAWWTSPRLRPTGGAGFVVQEDGQPDVDVTGGLRQARQEAADNAVCDKTLTAVVDKVMTWYTQVLHPS